MAQYAAPRAEAEVRAVANPAPLGLSAFALTTFVLSAANASLIAAPHIVLGLAFFYGGVVQLVAGIQEFRAGNTFGATAFCSYAGFWLAVGAIFTPTFGILTAYRVAAFSTALGIFLLGWTIFTLLMFLGSLRSNLALMAVFLVLFLTFLALTVGWLVIGGGSNGIAWIRIGGWLGIITALLAWYTALAGLLSAGKSMFHLPVWPRD